MQKITFYVTETDMEEFRYYLQERENSTATIGKYLHDVRTFRDFLGDEKWADKEKLLEYKEWLLELLCGQQCEFHAGGVESVSHVPGSGQAPDEAGEGTALRSDGREENAHEGGIPQAGAHSERGGEGTDRHDHGNHVRYRNPRQ